MSVFNSVDQFEPYTGNPKSFLFLKPILTPTALKVVQSQPVLFTTLILVLVALSLMGVLIWYTHFQTSKAYPNVTWFGKKKVAKGKKDAKGENKKGGK